MKAEIKIPKGWKRVKRGLSKDGDRYLQTTFLASNLYWRPCDVGNKITDMDMYIRKARPQKKKPSTPTRRPAK